MFISVSYDQRKVPPLVFLDMNILGILANTFQRPIGQRSFYQVPGESSALVEHLRTQPNLPGQFLARQKAT